MKEQFDSDRRILANLVPVVQRIIDESAEAGSPYPSNNKIAYILKNEFGYDLSKKQLSNIRNEIKSSKDAKP